MSSVFTVSEINEYIKHMFLRDPILRNIQIKGEVSNFKTQSSGHMYFSLKDENSLIRCVMFHQNNVKLSFCPENGMNVVVKGYISLYPKDGMCQLYAEEIKKFGIGDLYVKYEKLKKKLTDEGLFDKEHKKKIPFLPSKIGVVTSDTGAAVRDIIRISTRRFPNINLLIVPVRVQGQFAANEISSAIDYLNKRNDIDVIIVGRGGGSIEDLWAFNEEIVARSIYNSNIPVISAVGHETDFTIADFVADLRAPTPSAAAELAVPLKEDVLYNIDQLNHRIETDFDKFIVTKRNIINQLDNSLEYNSPINIIEDNKQYMDNINKLIEVYFSNILIKKKEQVNKLQSNLEDLNPVSILKRGYTITTDVKGQVIKSVNSLINKQRVKIYFSDGNVGAEIKNE